MTDYEKYSLIIATFAAIGALSSYFLYFKKDAPSKNNIEGNTISNSSIQQGEDITNNNYEKNEEVSTSTKSN